VAVFPVRHNVDLVNSINEYNQEHEHSLTHVVISAPWLSLLDMESLIAAYPDTQFVIESHSNVGFLQADPLGMRRLREALELSEIYSNLKVAGNSKRFVSWMRLVYDDRVVLLPNLYPLADVMEKDRDTSILKIGVFGAVRPLKNFMTAAAAALAIHKILGTPLELHMSTGGEGDGGDVTRSIDAMCKDLPDVKVIRHIWRPWSEFINTIAKMDLLLQPSFTESFNMITADGIFVGVPSVVSNAITWAPESWKADSDDALDIAKTGVSLLQDSKAVKEGIKAIEWQNKEGVRHWLNYLLDKPKQVWYDTIVKWLFN
jgi:hypothetical protein